MIILFVSALIFIVNIPFGIWRSNEKKLSLKWFLAIHIPVIISLVIRYFLNIDYEWYYIFVFITMFFLGQLVGKFIFNLFLKLN